MDIKNSSNYLIRTSSINAYINEIKRIAPITAEEEIALFKELEMSNERIKNANGDRTIILSETMLQDKIKQDIVARNQRFNFGIAKRYSNTDLVLDLVSVGAEGMMEAIDHYEYKIGTRFCTFAKFYIQRAINAFLTKENVMVRTTNDMKIIAKVKKIENSFFAREGRMPSSSEIKELLDKKYNIKNINICEFHMAGVDSIDMPKDSNDDNTYQTTPYRNFSIQTAAYNDYEDDAEKTHMTHKINEMLSCLSDREKLIVTMSVGMGHDREYKDYEIAEVINMTAERVRQIRKEAINKLANKYNLKMFRS
jgi:RNA polymerase primary sigma factor